MATETLSIKELAWPALPLAEWRETYATLHMWTQIVGKVRLALSPHINHWWEVPLYVTTTGLTTSLIPYQEQAFKIKFDFTNHKLMIETTWGREEQMWLVPRTVSEFYYEFLDLLHAVGISVKIWPMPVELPNPIRFDQDLEHGSYDSEYAHRWWRILLTTSRIFEQFRSGFVGKQSPVHFFWGSFDLAVTRFSGRRAPERVGADPITKEAYSHEVISAGFWPGGGGINDAAFYAYAAPQPPGFAEAKILPNGTFYSEQYHEFVLMYEAVRQSESPHAMLMEFLENTYAAGATLGRWDRENLERAAG